MFNLAELGGSTLHQHLTHYFCSPPVWQAIDQQDSVSWFQSDSSQQTVHNGFMTRHPFPEAQELVTIGLFICDKISETKKDKK